MSILKTIRRHLLELSASMVPLWLTKKLLPDHFILYGHVVSDGYHPVQDFYRHPTLLEFDRALKTFMKLGYQFVGLDEYVKTSPSKKKILVTFDDGFKNIYDELHPYMKTNHIPYVVFILSEPLVDERFYIKSIPYQGEDRLFLDRKEIIALKNDGVHIGFHTRTHMKIEEDVDLNDKRIDNELVPSAEVNELLSEPRSFAYPYFAPVNYQRIDQYLNDDGGFKYIFDTKGFGKPMGGHFFRVSIDVEKSLRKTDWLWFSINRQLLYYRVKQ